jgi:hypothetical protein
VALYRDPVLRRMLPELRRASDNADGAARSRSGYTFPPYFVLERGMTLREWGRQPRSHFEVSTMVERVAQLLAACSSRATCTATSSLVHNLLAVRGCAPTCADIRRCRNRLVRCTTKRTKRWRRCSAPAARCECA